MNKEDEFRPYYVPCVNCGETEFSFILRPDTLQSFDCPRCKGRTYVYVSKKQEVHVFGAHHLCPSCLGSGNCSECHGTGKVVCPKCEGKGWLEVGYSKYCPCEKCGGIGKEYWNLNELLQEAKKGLIKLGEGKVECSRCRGTGVCPECRGFRFKPSSLKR